MYFNNWEGNIQVFADRIQLDFETVTNIGKPTLKGNSLIWFFSFPLFPVHCMERGGAEKLSAWPRILKSENLKLKISNTEKSSLFFFFSLSLLLFSSDSRNV